MGLLPEDAHPLATGLTPAAEEGRAGASLLSQALEGARRPGWQLAVAQGDQVTREWEERWALQNRYLPRPQYGALLETEVPW